MQLVAYDGYWENGLFKPSATMQQSRGKVRAILTLLDEATQPSKEHLIPNIIQLNAFNKFIDAVRESGEEVPEFERVHFAERVEL